MDIIFFKLLLFLVYFQIVFAVVYKIYIQIISDRYGIKFEQHSAYYSFFLRKSDIVGKINTMDNKKIVTNLKWLLLIHNSLFYSGRAILTILLGFILLFVYSLIR